MNESATMTSDDIEYRIHGHDVQIVDITLDPGETVIAEKSALIHMSNNIEFTTHLGDGANKDAGVVTKFLSAAKRKMSGEDFFVNHFTNNGKDKATVTFSGPYPGSIVPIKLEDYNYKLICQKNAFIAAARGTKIDVHVNKRIATGFFAGTGFVLQKIKGDGLVFVHAGGSVIKKQLNNQIAFIEPGSLVAFTEGLDFDVKGLTPKNMMFGGEGLFLSSLSGTGHYWVASMPFSRFADKLQDVLPDRKVK